MASRSDVDIVDRLRIIWTSMTDMGNHERAEAADEIERLRQLSGDAGQLRKERDEARREIVESMHPDLRKGYDAARGWDCFKEVSDDR